MSAADAGDRSRAEGVLRVLGRVLLFLVICAVFFEISCRVYAMLLVYPRFERMRTSQRHFYQRSADPVLGYELRPDTEIHVEERWLRINRHGIRETRDEVPQGVRKVAILGDSVAFSMGHSQERTISALLQKRLDPDADQVAVLNFAVGGYAIDQILEFFRQKDAVYDVDDAIYLFNPNDLAQRDSVYEGADNGLYRIYHRPTFASLWFVRKAIYRYFKGSKGGSVGWYRWYFEGNEDWAREKFLAMRDYARREGIRFGVVLMPSEFAYTEEGDYVMTDLYEGLASFLREEGIPVSFPVEAFADAPRRYYDGTDHFHDEGSEVMADEMAAFARELDPALAAEADAGGEGSGDAA